MKFWCAAWGSYRVDCVGASGAEGRGAEDGRAGLSEPRARRWRRYKFGLSPHFLPLDAAGLWGLPALSV
jgi:hypothetical protein